MINFFTSHLAILWLVLGTFCIILEACILPGIGFFFAGLGAFTLGGLMVFGIIHTPSFFVQCGYFFLLTFIWGICLWKFFQQYLKRAHKPSYRNMIGERVIVVSPTLGKNEKGQISWSGTVMSALLDEAAPVSTVTKDTTLYIVSLSGTTVIVSPLPLDS